MADPLAPFTPGVLSPLVGSAAAGNSVLDQARFVRDNLRRRVNSGPPADDPLTPCIRVWVRNDTGADLDARAVVELGDSIVSITDFPHDARLGPLLEGVEPTGSDVPFAVLEGPVADGEVGRAVVMGVALADVDFTDASHGYASPQSGDVVMLSGTSGPCRVLQKEAGTGVLRALVLVDRQGSSAGVESGSFTGSNSITISADTTWTSASNGQSFSAGTYVLFARALGIGLLSAPTGVGTSNTTLISFRLWNDTDSAVIGTGAVCAVAYRPDRQLYGEGSLVVPVTFAGTKTVKFQGYRNTPYDSGGGQTWTSASIQAGGVSSGDNGDTRLDWLKIA